MTSVQSSADDIIQSLLTIDGIDEAMLLSDAVSSLSEPHLSRCLSYIKENHNLLTEDEARAKYSEE